jgi:hypothetical protein
MLTYCQEFVCSSVPMQLVAQAILPERLPIGAETVWMDWVGIIAGGMMLIGAGYGAWKSRHP